MNRAPLTREDFAEAARSVGCEPEVLMAIAEVETAWRPGKSGFASVPRSKWEEAHIAPIILYERHVFSRRTGGRFDKSHPHLSHPRWIPGTYGPSSGQHAKLQEAVRLEETRKTVGDKVILEQPFRAAALESCSWGVFQLMGFNWKMMGYRSIDDFITAMYSGDRHNLDGLLRFLTASNLAPALRSRDWNRIARTYNGAGYAKNAYHTKMAAAYRRFKA